MNIIANNKKAYHEYHVLEEYEAGIALTGSEVKSLRGGKVSIGDSYIHITAAEQVMWVQAHISHYKQAGIYNHNPTRPRTLLLHKREIGRIAGKVRTKGVTIIPLKLYFNRKGIAKMMIGLCKGKAKHDKREDIKKRDWDRQKARLMKERG